MPEFAWNSGLSAAQKRRNVEALHQAYNSRFPEQRVLEISSKSLEKVGVELSAFNLKKYVPELGRSVTVECVFQGSKVFSAGGPYTELYTATSREAKKDPRLGTSGYLKGFRFEGRDFPLQPVTCFYDWLYINALMENPELAEALVQYDAFTDIEFNPNKSLNCQARAAALFVSLSRNGLIDRCREFADFLSVIK
jgi:hypothetical protein